MLEVVETFLSYTGIRPETFGRLVLNCPNLYWMLHEPEFKLTDEERERVLKFIDDYEEIKK